MGDERSGRPNLTPVERERSLESAVLATLIEHHPTMLSEAQLVREMTAVVQTPGRPAAIERAVRGLVGVGLLDRRGRLLAPTPAALRVAELEIGL